MPSRGGVRRAGVYILLFVLLLGAVWLNYPRIFDGQVSLEAGDAPVYQSLQVKRSLEQGRFSSGNPAVGIGNIGPIIVGDHTALLYSLCPATKVEEVLMAVGSLFSALFVFLFLKDKGLNVFAALAGGAGFGLSTSLISLSSAGHTGKFSGLAYLAGSMWLMNRGLSRKQGFWVVFAGLFVGLSLAESRDFGMILMLGTGAYWMLLWCRLFFADRRASLRMLAPLFIAMIIACIVMLPVFSILMSGRSGMEDNGQGQPAGASGYDWATQWSLPSDELMKLVVPSYCGYDSWDPVAPYWGRMGRSAGWDVSRQGFRNFTQTNEYLGVVVLILAFVGIAAGAGASGSRGEGCCKGQARGETVFWVGLGLISLLLALGRYGFLYKVFYQLPFMSSIRNPVKFVHLVSLSCSVLSAFGLQYLMDATGRRMSLKAFLKLVLPAALAAVIIGAVLMASPWADRNLVARLNAEGFGAQLSGIQGAMFKGLLRSLGFAVLVLAGLFACRLYVRWAGPKGSSMFAGLVFVVLIGWDFAGVNRRYVNYYDPSTIYRSNAVMDYLKSFPEYRVKFIPHNQGIFNLWNSILVPYLSVKSADMPAESRRKPDIQQFYNALSSNPARMWNLMGVRHFVVPAEYEAELQKLFGGSLSAVRTFDLLQDRISGAVQPVFNQEARRGRFVILENTNALATPMWFSSARHAVQADSYGLLAAPAFDAGSVLIVDDESAGKNTLRESGGDGVTVRLTGFTESKITAETSAASDGWLFFGDYYDGNWKAFVDGREEKVRRADAIFMAVPVPSGNHSVSLEFCGSEKAFWLPLFAAAGAIVFSVGSFITGKRK